MESVFNAINKEFKIEMHNVQKKAVKEMLKGNIVDVSTGEGKTIIIIATAIIKALRGDQVVVLTPNSYLNTRDRISCQKIANIFNLTVKENLKEGNLKEIYKGDIIYTDCSEFVFDFLRNKENKEFVEMQLNKSLIVDEIDQVLVDNSNTNYSVSMGNEVLETGDLNMYKLVKHMCKFLIGGEIKSSSTGLNINEDKIKVDFIFNTNQNYVFLTNRGLTRIESLFNLSLNSDEGLDFYSTILNTLRANYTLKRGIHYEVIDNRISIIEVNNGRVKKGNQYESGINLALEIKEGCELTPIGGKEESINSMYFFNQFEDIVGCSGTAYQCKSIFKGTLGRDTKLIKRNKPLNLKIHRTCYFETKYLKYNKAKELVKDLHNKKHPVLVIGENDNVSKEFYEVLVDTNLDPTLLVNTNLPEEKDVFKGGGKSGAITISTLIAGRGVDIKTDNPEGLHVILLTRFRNLRSEIQIIGRTGRQGRRGHVYYFCCLDDEVFKEMNKWEVTKVEKWISKGKTGKVNRYVGKFQRRFYRVSAQNLYSMLNRNLLINLSENLLKERLILTNINIDRVDYYIKALNFSDRKGLFDSILKVRDFIYEL